MLDDVRRIVTGNDAEGRSLVVHDGAPQSRAGSGRRGIVEMWNTDGGPIDPGDRHDRAQPPLVLEPAAGGTKFFYFMVPPEEPGLTPQQQEERARAAFAAYGASGAQAPSARSPWMHKTRTVDYIIVLKGKVTLLLDGEERDLKPFDVVVQRATNHAWINRGSEPALMIAILIAADPV